MGRIKWCILISALLTLSQQSTNYRLPDNSIPHHYKLQIIPHIVPGNFTFDGESEISLEILNPTINLTLHSLNLTIHKEGTFLKVIGEEEFMIPKQHILEEEPQFLILNFHRELQPGNYTLRLKYTGIITVAPEGLFWESYFNDNNETIYLVATFLEPTYARTIFPCWDEPALKATFDISIKHFPNYTALSNMPSKKNLIEVKGEIDEKIWTNFQTTPPVSTYLVAFSVSDFGNITIPQGNFSVWSRKNVLDSMKSGYNFGLKAFPVLEEYTDILYELPKMDVMAIPNRFTDGAMENWGLIMITEGIIFKNSSSSFFQEFTAYEYIVHEIAHQWFGNLVSPAWWKDLWLTEGLSTYFHFFLTAKMLNFPRKMDFFVVDNIYEAYIKENDPLSLPLFREVNTANEAIELSRKVHVKAGTMMHMLSGLISEDVFHAGLKKLLQRYRLKTITTDDFWETMQETMDDSKLPNNNFDIKKVMESYILQIGYPVINAFRNYTTGAIKLTQECPVCLQNKNNNSESKFWIPINFATSTSLNFSSTSATHWMKPEEKELIVEGVDPNDWIIINIQNSAFYRVNYDEKNWKKIADYMDSDKFSNIHVLNRAQLLDDVFWLFKNKKLDKNVLLYLTSYMVRELDYIPWSPGSQLLSYLESTTDVKVGKNYILPLKEALDNARAKFEEEMKTIFRDRTDSSGFSEVSGHCSKKK